MENKKIEEMARTIQKGELDRNRGDLDCTEFPTDLVIKVGLQRLAGAKALYNEGYRKASEVAREIFKEIEENSIIQCLFGFNPMVTVRLDTYEQFKKKYTEGGE